MVNSDAAIGVKPTSWVSRRRCLITKLAASYTVCAKCFTIDSLQSHRHVNSSLRTIPSQCKQRRVISRPSKVQISLSPKRLNVLEVATPHYATQLDDLPHHLLHPPPHSRGIFVCGKFSLSNSLRPVMQLTLVTHPYAHAFSSPRHIASHTRHITRSISEQAPIGDEHAPSAPCRFSKERIPLHVSSSHMSMNMNKLMKV